MTTVHGTPDIEKIKKALIEYAKEREKRKK